MSEAAAATTNPNAESFSSFTVLAFAVISLVVYMLFLRPTAAPTPARPPPHTNTNARGVPPAAAAPPARRRVVVGDTNNNGTSWDRQRPATSVLSETALQLLTACQAKPAFCKNPEKMNGKTTAVGLGGSNVLVDGLVGFRHTQASSVVPEDNAASVRKERAKILSKLVVLKQSSVNSVNNANVTTPPTKGATIVVSVPHDQVACDSLRRIFYLLGSYYNLLVLLAVPEPTDGSATEMGNLEHQKKELIQRLRGGNDDNDATTTTTLLTEAVLPSHRILLSSTIAGRVAFVRQLNRVELVVDFDGLVEAQLTRFGYRVFLYGLEHKKHASSSSSWKATSPTSTESSVSALGAELLSS
jgi:hypothetical protein